ncbi:sirohydrochlorin chelatase [Gemmatimonadota bacterium]
MLIIIAHGSPKDAWQESVEELLRSLQEEAGEDRVHLAYLRHGSPTMEDVLAEVITAGATKIRILPLFLADGGHVTADIRPLVDEVRSRHGQIDMELLPAVGQHPLFRDMLLELISGPADREQVRSENP